MSYKTQDSIVDERPQVCDDFHKSNKIENYENLVIVVASQYIFYISVLHWYFPESLQRS